MLKRYFLIILILSAFLLGACGNKENITTASDGEGYNWRAASHVPEDHPNSQALFEIADRIEKESDGRIKIKVYPANQLGDYTTVYEELGRGSIEFASISTPSQLDKNLELVYMPYLAKSYEEVKEVYGKSSYLFEELHKVHDKLGVKLLGFHAEGFGGIGSTKEIKNLTDPSIEKPLLIRVPQMQIFQQPIQDLGFKTVSIPYAELYTSLQTGSADGWSGGGVTSNYTEFRDVIKYYYETKDFFDASSIMVSKSLWSELSKEDQTMIENIVDDISSKSIEFAEENEQIYRSKLEEAGIKYIKLKEQEIEPLYEYVRETSWTKLKKRFGNEIIDNLE